MKLLVSNVAKVNYAEIEIKGITTLIGFNATGKSTVSRSMASIAEMFSWFDEKVVNEKILEIQKVMGDWEAQYRNVLRSMQREVTDVQARKTINMLYNERRHFHPEIARNMYFCDDFKQFTEVLYRTYKVQEIMQLGKFDELEQSLNDTVKQIYSKIEGIKNNDFITYEKNVIIKTLSQHFGKEYSSYYNEKPMKIELWNDKGEKNCIQINDNGDIQYEKSSTEDIFLSYIQPQHILDGINVWRWNIDMEKMLLTEVQDETATEREERVRAINVVNSLLESEIEIGKLKIESDSLMYLDTRLNRSINITNVASGAKSIVMIKRLAEIGKIRKNTILIIDEPEQNLHPEWQLLLAKILVVLQREIGIKVFINTHSPYFLRAIEYYADENKILNMCKFYYMNSIENGQTIAKDMTDKLDMVYDEMAAPLDKLIVEGSGEDESI